MIYFLPFITIRIMSTVELMKTYLLWIWILEESRSRYFIFVYIKLF